jgi:23S rRNA pseudouridine2605 synthase
VASGPLRREDHSASATKRVIIKRADRPAGYKPAGDKPVRKLALKKDWTPRTPVAKKEWTPGKKEWTPGKKEWTPRKKEWTPEKKEWSPRKSSAPRSPSKFGAQSRRPIHAGPSHRSAIGLVKKGEAKPLRKVLTKPQTESVKPPLSDGIEGPGTVRLNKFISNAGITSRRKADELIVQGSVTVNGKVVKELGVQVKPYQDHITVDGETISMKSRHVYLLLNKPKDTIATTSDEKDRTTVLDYVDTHERVYPVGRLDRNTTGVLLLTNDGELTNRLTHPSFEIEREYHVTLDKPLAHSHAKQIAEGGINIGEGEVTGKAEVLVGEDDSKDVILKLREGKNREVRRIFEALGYDVAKLDRVSFAGITHRGMSRGESRQLTAQEVRHLRKMSGIEV